MGSAPREVKQPQDLHTVPHQVTSVATALMRVARQQHDIIFLLENTLLQPPQIQKGKRRERPPREAEARGSAGRLPGADSAQRTRVPAPRCLGLGLRDPAGTAKMLPPPGTGRAWPPLPPVASPARWQSTGQVVAEAPALHQPEFPKTQTSHASPYVLSTWKTAVCDLGL